MMLLQLVKHFTLRPLLTVRNPIYEERFLKFMRTMDLSDFSTPAEFFSGTSNHYLKWLFSYADAYGYDIKGFIPKTPPYDMQRNWTGLMGEAAMAEAMNFFEIVSDMAAKYSGRIGRETKILDFGCGWGRIIRFFMRDVDHANLYGVDCYLEALEMAKSQNKWVNFQLIGARPPIPLEEKFDVIYLFSVFSHLSESLHLELLQEFSRLLKPDGLLIATTRPRDFILRTRQLRQLANQQAQDRGGAATFADTEKSLTAYEAGEFCFDPSGGGGVLESSFYGEACIPLSYVKNTWSKWFQFRQFRLADKRCNQNVICVPKK
jgi:SAM-dependent methyltransferase